MINRELDLKQKNENVWRHSCACMSNLAHCKIEKDHLYQDVLIAGWVCDIKAD